MRYSKYSNSSDKDFHIDMTPMIDVILVLLIFFMVATSFDKFSSMNINVPKSSVKNKLQDIDEINVLLDKSGELKIKTISSSLNEEKKIAENQLQKEINTLIESHNVKAITLIADESLDYGKIIKIMSYIKEAGAENISLKTIN